VGACGNSGNVRISGSRPRSDDNLLDGTPSRPPVFGGQDVQPTVEAIGEFRIAQNNMSAECGKAGGAIIIAVSKSGTNQFHGSAYEYNRNQNLDTKDYFVDPGTKKNPLTYDEFDGSLGGPIIKGKLFFFSDYEGIRQHGSQPSAGVLVPDGAFRAGDLSALCPEGLTAGVCNNRAHQIFFPGTSIPGGAARQGRSSGTARLAIGKNSGGLDPFRPVNVCCHPEGRWQVPLLSTRFAGASMLRLLHF